MFGIDPTSSAGNLVSKVMGTDKKNDNTIPDGNYAPAGLKSFISELRESSVARTNQYSVMMGLPPQLQWYKTTFLKKVLLFCNSVTLPGINLDTTTHHSYGTPREMPTGLTLPQVTMTFYVDTQMNIKMIFEDWMQQVMHPMRGSLGYYKDYAQKVNILVEDLRNQRQYEVILHEAYPKSMGDIELGYDQGGLMTLHITWQYKYWTSSTYQNMVSDGSLTNWDMPDWFNDAQDAASQLSGKMGGTFGNKNMGKIKGVMKAPANYINQFKGFQNVVNSAVGQASSILSIADIFKKPSVGNMTTNNGYGYWNSDTLGAINPPTTLTPAPDNSLTGSVKGL